ncbi:MAG: peptidylprolyl isomerase [Bacteroidota bacterium]
MKFSIALLGLLISTAAFAQPTPQVIDEIIAVVGNEIVLASDLASQKASLREQYKSEPDDCEVIEDRLMLNQAKVDSVEVSEQQLNSELDRRIRFFVQQFGSEKKMEEFYGKSIVELKEEFHDQLADQMRVQQMQGKITEDINVTPADVEKFYRRIPVDSLPLISSQVEVAQIVIYPAENSSEVSRTIERLERFRKEIAEGKDFSVLASLYSEDPGSAIEGGDLGMQEKGTFVPEFDAVAFSLNNGEISKVFKSQFGYHIMQMVERIGDKYHARHILLKPKVRTEDLSAARTKLDSLVNVMRKDTLSFEKAAVKFSMDDDTKNNGGILVNPQTGSPRFDMREIDPQISFTIDKLEVGEMSSPVLVTTTTGTQGYRILKLVERTQPHRANLREDYQTIQEAASGEVRSAALKEWVNRRIQTTYIKVEDRFIECSGRFNWKKS